MDAITNHPILNITILDNTILSYLIALGIFIISYSILKFFKFVILNRLKAFAEKTSFKWDDLIIELINMIGWPFYALLSLYISIQFLVVPPIVITILKSLLIIVSAFYAIKIVLRIVEVALQTWNEHREEKLDPSIIQMIHTVIKISLWSLAFITILANLGYDVSALIAGLGIGSLAVAFAFQRIMEDVFAYFVIHIDRPFKVGETVIVNGEGGTIERIGIKSTRIRSLKSGEELIVSNSQLLNSWIHNYGRVNKRRHLFTIGVTYETPTEKMKQIPEIIKEIVEKEGGSKVEFDRAVFKSYGDFSLNYEIVFYVKERDYGEYLRLVEKIYLAIKERFEKEGIEFAYPTQTVYLKQEEGFSKDNEVGKV